LGKNAFSILELMVVIAIISVLAAIAIPAYLSHRDKAKITHIASDLRNFRDGFMVYVAENGCFPPDSHNDAPYNLKNGYGTEDYLPIQAWITEPYWGGFYNWEGLDNYPYAGISLYGTTASQSIMTKLDRVLDNGDLSTGVFRKTPNGRYTYIVQDSPEDTCT
jgi:type IV pilus assembly protein PilA